MAKKKKTFSSLPIERGPVIPAAPVEPKADPAALLKKAHDQIVMLNVGSKNDKLNRAENIIRETVIPLTQEGLAEN